MAQAAQALIGDSEFDRDTAVTLREEGVYDAELSAGWTIINAVNGGYLLAILGRALGDALPHPDPFTVSAHYLTASGSRPRGDPHAGRPHRPYPLHRSGVALPVRRRTAPRSSASASSPPTATWTPSPTTSARRRSRPPCRRSSSASARATARRPSPAAPRSPSGSTSSSTRRPSAGPSAPRPARARCAAGSASRTAATPTRYSLLLTVDALPPTSFELGLKGWTPTVELTTHIRCRPAPGPLRVSITTRNLAGGFLEEDADVWDSADRLVAQSRQLARAPRS